MTDIAAPHRRSSLYADERVTLVETLDRVLNKGAVIVGDLTISVADIDLLYVRLSVLVSSVQKLDSLAARKGRLA